MSCVTGSTVRIDGVAVWPVGRAAPYSADVRDARCTASLTARVWHASTRPVRRSRSDRPGASGHRSIDLTVDHLDAAAAASACVALVRDADPAPQRGAQQRVVLTLVEALVAAFDRDGVHRAPIRCRSRQTPSARRTSRVARDRCRAGVGAVGQRRAERLDRGIGPRLPRAIHSPHLLGVAGLGRHHRARARSPSGDAGRRRRAGRP